MLVTLYLSRVRSFLDFLLGPLLETLSVKITLTGDQWAHTELHFPACLQTIYLPDRHNRGS